MSAVPLAARELAIARGSRTLAQGVELELRRGEVVALLGPNGAGKSTLLATLAGLLEPAAGRVERGGRVAAALQAPALARRSVRANVEAALAWWGVPRDQRRERALTALRALRVEQLAERPAAALSGGEARRVHLARGLALQPDALLLDEPFAGLDAPTRAELLHDASTLLRAPERATLLVVHDRAEAWALADRVAVLLDGELVSGPTAELLEQPPTAALAGFLGFSGELREADGASVRLRPGHVVADPAGPLAGRVTHRIPEEDGLLCELELEDERGLLQLRLPHPGPAAGELVRVRIDGGVRIAAGAR
ncbi:ATP-binding cassette domain-containing protein [Conexibacter sp. JD483]|uniref:ATP-binding cassette domain-containing protein n=1 Tax=unclassified Conexibacter TaxID=2627773 RepID=UPI0027222D18|nr:MULTISPECIES: ATP-binding cassette domain-containing protein [unclassified Conexibacter]MDO8186081.1 ATP-binding cassette domain-containing protein [Conexibacter sp. CPCC 205706]MDO8199571.1 ATP-binding cassette domain-containing protein [Conexibacter sp. CPCC 205762]MDR9373016.1 ATP-binding cassette domain-containing protein [Conexibacter sp. JD483]